MSRNCPEKNRGQTQDGKKGVQKGSHGQKENITPKAKIRERIRGRVMERRVNLMKFPMGMTLVTGGGTKTTVGGLARIGMFRKCMTRGFLMVVGILVRTGMQLGKKHRK